MNFRRVESEIMKNNHTLSKEKLVEDLGKNNTSKEGIAITDIAHALLGVRDGGTEMREDDILTLKSKAANARMDIKFLYVGKYKE